MVWNFPLETSYRYSENFVFWISWDRVSLCYPAQSNFFLENILCVSTMSLAFQQNGQSGSDLTWWRWRGMAILLTHVDHLPVCGWGEAHLWKNTETKALTSCFSGDAPAWDIVQPRNWILLCHLRVTKWWSIDQGQRWMNLSHIPKRPSIWYYV
jgi:hypothetical protein